MSGTELVLAEVAPYATAVGAARLARHLGVPWIADLQDPWALDEMWLYPSLVHRALDRRRMRSTLRTAAAVVMNTPEAAARVRQSFPELDGRVNAIPNGFSAEDFAAAPAAPTDARPFRIVHSGHLYTAFAEEHARTRTLRRLAGGMPDSSVDFLARSHVFMLEAVARVISERQEAEHRVEVHLIGALTAADRRIASHYGFVRERGFVSHRETIEELKLADLLFLPLYHLQDGKRAGIVPSKTYEYMASGRPILAAVPAGDARDMLLELGTTDICQPRAVDCMKEAIDRRFTKWLAGDVPQLPDSAVLARYEYASLAGKMKSLIELVLRERTSGSVDEHRR